MPQLRLPGARPARALLLLVLLAPPAAAQERLARQVEIRRTTYGVPHIRAENLRAAGYALGYVQMEDYGYPVVHGLVRNRGELARHFGRDSLESDFRYRGSHARALETYHLLGADTRDVLEGFAAGVNRYLELHPEEFPAWASPAFSGVDVHALSITRSSPGTVQRVKALLDPGAPPPWPEEPAARAEDGSNAWALAPARTRSGRAILLRNPHLSWTAGYHEAHVTVPGVLDFYGDFRIGGPLVIIGGFNRHLGWSTTNNAVDTDALYSLRLDPERPDHYLLDGAPVPLRRESVRVEYRTGTGVAAETREGWRSELGPVIHRSADSVYVLRSAGDGEYRGAEQFLRMMRASSLEEWQEAMRMQARSSSNFTYADAQGNIFYVWNATLPLLPHAPSGTTRAFPAASSADVWTRVLPFDSLPQLLNPPGGYVRNENDSPHYTNLNRVLDPGRFPANHEQPRLRLRSQHALELIHGDRRLGLEEVVELKHSMRMLLADRVKDDLLAAVRQAGPGPELRAAAGVLERWDNTAAADSRGAVLFETWWLRYEAMTGPDSAFRHPWTPADPLGTPRGLADPRLALDAFRFAVEETARRHGSVDVAWGEVHRVRRGGVDVPVGGCAGALGCFRVLTFEEAPDGRRQVDGGDGWVLAVEFSDPPRAFSVLGYGQSIRPDSPHHTDQAGLFASNRMKPVAFTEEEIERSTIRRYRPGEERRP